MKRRGFTIIEVSLFLAISALLFVGIATGTGVNIARQRYNNAVQDYAEFLRRLYSEVENVQNGREDNSDDRLGNCTISSDPSDPDANSEAAYGRTNCAIYGKIAIFDERQPSSSANTDTIKTYDIIGNVIDNDHMLPASATTTVKALSAVNAEYLAFTKAGSGCKLSYAGGNSSYTPDWGSYIERPDGRRFSGAIMIVRSPLDGTIHTLSLELDSTRISDVVGSGSTWGCSNSASAISAARSARAYLQDYYANNSFSMTRDINFCVDSDDAFAYNGRRRNIRLKADGHNSSAVEVIDLDNEAENACV